MYPMNTMFENLYACKELHSILFYSICEKYNLTIAEILVLLYLAGAKVSCVPFRAFPEKTRIPDRQL